MSAVARILLAGGVAAGMVVGAGHVTSTADVGRRGDVPTLAGGSASMRQQLVCPGPDRPGAQGTETDRQSVEVQVGLAPAAVASGTGGTLTSSRLPGTAGGAASLRTARPSTDQATLAGAGALQIAGSGPLATGLAAVQTDLDRGTAVAGLGVGTCTAPVSDTWVPLGGGEEGHIARLVLSNPGANPVTVNATVVGSAGQDPAHSAQGVVVPPQGRTVVLMGSFTGPLASAMVHVTATGGTVAVAAADTLMRGETPAGQSLVGPSAPPSTSQQLPVVAVGKGTSTVRVAVPGNSDAIVRVRLTDGSGNVAADQVQTVTRGTVAAIGLPDVPAGSYSAQVTADEPIVAAALTQSAATGPADLAWAQSTAGITDIAGSPVPQAIPGVTTSLMLSAGTAGAKVEVHEVSPAGQDTVRTVSVAGDRPTLTTLAGVAAVWLKVRSGTAWAGLVMAGSAGTTPVLETVALPPLLSQAQARDTAAAGE